MAEIFVSYASEDRERVSAVVERLLARSHSVWWDRQLLGGTHFPAEIEKEISAARIVLVAWSQEAIHSPWVIDEAELGRNHGKLMPIALDAVLPPLGFRQIQTIDFSGWQGDEDDTAFQKLIAALANARTGNPPRAGNEIDARAQELASQPVTPPSASIAVLPFVNMSADPEQEYFSDGISEELLNLLAKIREAHVAARTSSFQFKGRALDVSEIGRLLNVANILEGSVRKAGNRVRVTAQLVRSDTGYHLWSESFDRELTDIFEIQDEIARAIVAALQEHLISKAGDVSAPQALRTAAGPDEAFRAYDFYLLGSQALKTRTEESCTRALDFFRRSLGCDAEFVPALAGSAIATLLLSDGFGCVGHVPLATAAAEALPYIKAALARDPEMAESHIAMAYYHQLHRDFEAAKEAAEDAIALNPNDPRGYGLLATAKAQGGEPDGTIVSLRRKILELDPLSLSGLQTMAFHNYTHLRFAEAEELVRRMEEVAPGALAPVIRRIWLYIHEGRLADALDLALSHDEMWRETSGQRAILPLLVFLGEAESAAKWSAPYALHYALEAGFLDDAYRIAAHVPGLASGDGQTDEADYRLALDGATLAAFQGDWQGVRRRLSPFDVPEEKGWGLHFYLTYQMKGALLRDAAAQALGEEETHAALRTKIETAYRELVAGREGTHFIAHRIGAFLALQDGNTQAAVEQLEQQWHSSRYGALAILGTPVFAGLAGVAGFDRLKRDVAGHLADEREKASKSGALEKALSYLAQARMR